MTATASISKRLHIHNRKRVSDYFLFYMEGLIIFGNRLVFTVQLPNLCQKKSTITAFSHRLQCGYHYLRETLQLEHLIDWGRDHCPDVGPCTVTSNQRLGRVGKGSSLQRPTYRFIRITVCCTYIVCHLSQRREHAREWA